MTASRASLVLEEGYTEASYQDRFQMWLDDPMRKTVFSYMLVFKIQGNCERTHVNVLITLVISFNIYLSLRLYGGALGEAIIIICPMLKVVFSLLELTQWQLDQIN